MVRRGVVVLLLLAVLAAALSVVDVLVKDGVQSAIADRVTARSPGAQAKVKITSFPFVGRLAWDGTVPELRVDATGVTAGALTLSRVVLDVHRLKVSRHELGQGALQVVGVGSGTVTASIDQAEIDRLTHLQLTLGEGRVGWHGLSLSVRTRVVGTRVTLRAGSLPALRVRIPVLDLLPCVGSVAVVPGALQLSCRFTSVPGLLAGQTFHA